METEFQCPLIHSSFDPWAWIAQVIKYWKYCILSKNKQANKPKPTFYLFSHLKIELQYSQVTIIS